MELYLVVCFFDNLFSIIIYVAAEDTFEYPAKVNSETFCSISCKVKDEIIIVMRIEFSANKESIKLYNMLQQVTLKGLRIPHSGFRIPDSLPCLLYTSPSPRDGLLSRMPSSA